MLGCLGAERIGERKKLGPSALPLIAAGFLPLRMLSDFVECFCPC